MKAIERVSAEIANEIKDRNYFDMESVSALIKMRIHGALHEMAQEFATKEEINYLRLVEKQKRLPKGSAEYYEIGHQLQFAKHAKSSANRLANNLKKEDRYTKLKEYIIDLFGKEILKDFFAKEGTGQNL